MPGMFFSVFVDKEFKPLNGNICHVCKVVINSLNLVFDACNQLVSLIFAELQDALHLYFHQF